MAFIIRLLVYQLLNWLVWLKTIVFYLFNLVKYRIYIEKNIHRYISWNPYIYTTMSNNYNGNQSNKSLIIPSKNSDPVYYNLNLHNYHNYHHYLQNIAKWKDRRLELVEIPKGLIEVLQNAGFTIEKILDSCPSEIAEKLGIDVYIGEIIFKETKKAISKINPDVLLVDK